MSHINIIIGTAGHTDLVMGFLEKSVIQHSFDILSKYGIKHLGTAQIYGNGNVEAFLGETAPAGTKWPGGFTHEWICTKTQSLYF
jgi:predicted oxidoreductase